MSLYLSRIEGPPPKRNAPGSNPGRDATNNAESLDFSRFSAFLIFRHHSILTFPFCHRFCPVLAKKGERSC